MKQIWAVVRYWPGGKQEVLAGFLSEEAARAAAGREAGKDGALIALITIPIEDCGDVDQQTAPGGDK